MFSLNIKYKKELFTLLTLLIESIPFSKYTFQFIGVGGVGARMRLSMLKNLNDHKNVTLVNWPIVNTRKVIV